ncbi:hypothetical protein LTS18_000782 [Coniosporium uncinatum]|uniref:Uncharacterized protein n=1 Tax=Coniosporium uncinatum TaxID=93489 RepID=A0ACC3D8G6_9PEZI|nr:hypothetical protein LTS18_000782 [Coniosporium uncinatum]
MVGKYAAKKLLSSQMNKNKDKHNAEPAGSYDPYYSRIPDPRRPGKTKKVKKQIPDYLNDNDAMVLAKARKRAYKWDLSLFNLAGVRFGWGAVIGIIPLLGDFADGLMALMIVRSMMGITDGLPSSVLMRMLLNVALDLGVGFIPILGDLADAAFKANCKNVRLLEQHLDKKYKPAALTQEEKRMEQQRKEEYRRSGLDWRAPEPATIYEDFSDEEYDRREDMRPHHNTGPTQPGQARTQPERHGGPVPDPRQKKAGWFSGAGGRERPSDVESGMMGGQPRQQPSTRQPPNRY